MHTSNSPGCHRSARKAGSVQRGRRGWSAGRRGARVGGAAVCRHNTVDQLRHTILNYVSHVLSSWLASFSSSTDTSWPLVKRRDKTKRLTCWNMTVLYWLESTINLSSVVHKMFHSLSSSFAVGAMQWAEYTRHAPDPTGRDITTHSQLILGPAPDHFPFVGSLL